MPVLAILGTAECSARFLAFEKKTIGVALSSVQAACKAAKETADLLTPVDTGYLLSRNKTRMIERGPLRYVGDYYNDAPYAAAVAMGHHTRSGSWVAPQDFMTGAFVVGRSVLFEQASHLF